MLKILISLQCLLWTKASNSQK